MLILALSLALGCQADTPENAFEAVKKAVLAKDWGALFEAIAPADRKEIDESVARQKELMAKPEGARELKMTAQLLGVAEKDLLEMKPREFMVKMMGKMAEMDKAGFEKEFSKYTQGKVLGSTVDGDAAVLKVKAGDKEEEIEFAREGGKWYMSMAKEKRESNQRNASARLKSAVTAQADFRANDRDADKENNYWVKDVAGLYGLEAGGEAIQLIEPEIAQADRTAGKGTYPSVKEEKPSAGYYFATLKRYQEEGKGVPYDQGKGRNLNRFGLITYPAEYPKTGKLTYIVNEANVIFSKDTRGRPIEEFPVDPKKDGWTPLD